MYIITLIIRYLAIPLCAISVLNCFPSNDIICAACVALAAAKANEGAKLTVIKTLPPIK